MRAFGIFTNTLYHARRLVFAPRAVFRGHFCRFWQNLIIIVVDQEMMVTGLAPQFDSKLLIILTKYDLFFFTEKA
jgi:hypothetical protein